MNCPISFTCSMMFKPVSSPGLKANITNYHCKKYIICFFTFIPSKDCHDHKFQSSLTLPPSFLVRHCLWRKPHINPLSYHSDPAHVTQSFTGSSALPAYSINSETSPKFHWGWILRMPGTTLMLSVHHRLFSKDIICQLEVVVFLYMTLNTIHTGHRVSRYNLFPVQFTWMTSHARAPLQWREENNGVAGIAVFKSLFKKPSAPAGPQGTKHSSQTHFWVLQCILQSCYTFSSLMLWCCMSFWTHRWAAPFLII